MKLLSLPEKNRRSIFHALVTIQDAGMEVSLSRELVARQYALIDAELRLIEEEGLVNEWPPL
jgi:hypothetical protein